MNVPDRIPEWVTDMDTLSRADKDQTQEHTPEVLKALVRLSIDRVHRDRYAVAGRALALVAEAVDNGTAEHLDALAEVLADAFPIDAPDDPKGRIKLLTYWTAEDLDRGWQARRAAPGAEREAVYGAFTYLFDAIRARGVRTVGELVAATRGGTER